MTKAQFVVVINEEDEPRWFLTTDEVKVKCPHCGGRGETFLSELTIGTDAYAPSIPVKVTCFLCGGQKLVGKSTADKYNADQKSDLTLSWLLVAGIFLVFLFMCWVLSQPSLPM